MRVSLFCETEEDAQDEYCTTGLTPEDILAGLEKREKREWREKKREKREKRGKGVNFFFSP